MSPEEPITVHVNRVSVTVELSPADVRRAVTAAAEYEGVATGEFSVTFIDIESMTALNETHLKREGATDVIAFSLGEPSQPLGDIYICPGVAAESAREYDVDLREELLRLVVHGVLHVLGHDHPEGPERGKSEMFRRQEAILSGLGRSDPGREDGTPNTGRGKPRGD